jgi:preprotein translocase subunit YajC
MFISPAYAQTAGAAGEGSFLIQLAPLILIFVVFYFLLIRPQQKKMKAHKAMVAGLRRGDRVVTAGGIIGVVTKILSDTEAQLEIADGVRVRIVRATITDVLSKTAPADNAEEADLEEDAATENGDKKARSRQIGGRGK